MSGTRRLRFVLRPSRAFAGWILAGHTLAGLCTFAIVPAPAGAVAALLALLLGLASTWRVALLRSPSSPAVLEIGEGGSLHARLRGGGSMEAVKAPRHVTRFWVVVPTASGPLRRLLVTADMLEPGDFRRLRVWALWGGIPGLAPAPELI